MHDDPVAQLQAGEQPVAQRAAVRPGVRVEQHVARRVAGADALLAVPREHGLPAVVSGGAPGTPSGSRGGMTTAAPLVTPGTLMVRGVNGRATEPHGGNGERLGDAVGDADGEGADEVGGAVVDAAVVAAPDDCRAACTDPPSPDPASHSAAPTTVPASTTAAATADHRFTRCSCVVPPLWPGPAHAGPRLDATC